MNTINLSKLINMLKTVMSQHDYSSPRHFLECKIFNDDNEEKIVNNFDNVTWMDLSDGNTISELCRSKLGHHISPKRHCFIATKLIVFYYKGVFGDIEASIANDLAKLDDKDRAFILDKLAEFREQGLLPLLNGYEITIDKLAQAIVACALHCFVFDYGNKPTTVKYSCAKNNVLVLIDSGVSERKFKADFPVYETATDWKEVSKTPKCYKRRSCSRCKCDCVELDSNYNVTQLLKLYLNLNVKTDVYEEDEDIDLDDVYNMMDMIVDTLRSETKSVYIKILVRKKMSANEKLRCAMDLLLQDKINSDNEK